MKLKVYLFCSFCLFCSLLNTTTWHIKQDGTGDFISIQEAVSSPLVVDGDKIIVSPGTYYEDENVTIDKNITVASLYHTTGLQQYIESTIIDGSQNPAGSVITTVENLDDCLIEGFTIRGLNSDAGKGVLIYNSFVKVNQCIITNIRFGIYIDGWGNEYFSPLISNNLINNNFVGISCVSPVIPQIIGNEISYNEVCGINLIDSTPPTDNFPLIKGNILYNHDSLDSYAIIASRILELEDNCMYDNECCIKLDTDILYIYNNTFYGNQRIFDRDGAIGELYVLSINCIFSYNAQFLPSGLGEFAFNIFYSRVQNTSVPYHGFYNITDDPLFIEPTNNNFNLSWTETVKSPCIDTGCPESQYNDPDGTRADMGALYHPHEIKTYEFPDANTNNGWKWLSFDILDITMTGDNNTVDPLLIPIQDDLIQGLGQSVLFYYTGLYWHNGDHEITSPQGYKFQTENECGFDISGFRCDEHTTFPVLSEMPSGNWIGYFLDESQHVYDAFAGYLDNIYKILAQHWSVKYNNGWPEVPYTLNPGDMVIVWCQQDIPNFSWIDDIPREPFNVGEVQNFTYLEESDYIPIYIQLDPEDLPTEIGTFIDGECKGATVVQDTSAQICAYIMENQGSSLEFEFYYGSRSENKVIREYNVYDPETTQTEKGSIKVEQNRDCYYVSFKNEHGGTPASAKLEASNYPNPFNPVTTIAYSLPEESQISILIYNIKGQKVKTLATGTQPAGDYNVTWDGKDESGKDVTSGIYFYKLRTDNKELTRKMLLLK